MGSDIIIHEDAADLFAACIAANVDEAARISNILIESEARQKRYFAKALIDLVEGLERIPDFVRTATIDQLLARAAVAADSAWRAINEGEPSA